MGSGVFDAGDEIALIAGSTGDVACTIAGSAVFSATGISLGVHTGGEESADDSLKSSSATMQEGEIDAN